MEHAGIRILPGHDLPSEMPAEASALYARNISAFCGLLVDDDGAVTIDLDDEVVAGALLTSGGEVTHQPTADLLGVES